MHKQKVEIEYVTRTVQIIWCIAMIAVLPVLSCGGAWADASILSYQGVLRDAASAAVADGNYAMIFSIWDAESGGTKRWGDELHDPVATQDGFFAVQLGETQALGSLFTTYSALWLEITVDGELYGPRVPMSSVPYARHAATAGTAANGNPPGAVLPYAGSSAPSGYFLCDGSAVSRTTYAALFNAIGTLYGTGDGSTTFNLPDLRGVFPKGAGTTNRALGKDANGNFYSAALGTYATDRFQGHKHTYTTPQNYDDVVGGSGTSARISTTGTTLATVSDGVNGAPRTGTTTEPQSLALTFIIKY